MKTLHVLDWPQQRYYGESHPFHRWKTELKDQGLALRLFNDHAHPQLSEADYLLLHSRYFEAGWQNIYKRNAQNEALLICFLAKCKQSAGKLIWLDAADSTGSADFPIIPYVDRFLKKQLLTDFSYYTSHQKADLRIWMNNRQQPAGTRFIPCPPDQLHKIKLAWNIGLNDYRYYGYKMSRLSNYLNYNWYPNWYTPADKIRKYDLTFRGTSYKNGKDPISYQRSLVFEAFNTLNMEIASGRNISKWKYWKELRNSKLSVSPFGWGEICYRDFESFLSGAILVKPSMEHLVTYPDVYRPNETYIPVPWDMGALHDVLEHLVGNYKTFKDIAVNGQQLFRKAVDDPKEFITVLKRAIG